MHAFPGGTAVTSLTVYDGASLDGLAGGTPHLHTASTEGYIVVGGSGAIQTIEPSGFRETPLQPGVVVWFTPGTVHRAINHGGLYVICVMQNSGLPEAGDAVMSFADEIVSDAERYREAATLPSGTGQDTATAARIRRDLGVQGFLELRAAIESGDSEPLERFYAHAARLVQPRIAAWRETWERGAHGATINTDTVLNSLAAADSSTLRSAALFEAEPNEGDERFGMCGRLRTYDVTPRQR